MEDALRIHAAGSVLCRLFLASPDDGLAGHLSDPGMLDAWPLADALSARGIAHLRSGAPDTKEALARDHLYLFTGVSSPLAQPYESPYVSDEGLMFDDAVIARVRDLYATFGFYVPQRGAYPDDHIGYEIAFVAAGCNVLTQPAEISGVSPEVAATATRTMLTEHLARYAPQVLEQVREHATTRVYEALPDLTAGFLDSAARFLDGPAGFPDGPAGFLDSAAGFLER